MAKIEGIRIKNFRTLKNVQLGKLFSLLSILDESKSIEPLTPMTVVIGKNGVGKSTLFDAFGFLADAFKCGVEEACYLRDRGGFEKIRSQGQTGAIEFSIDYKEDGSKYPINYNISINIDNANRPFVEKESVIQRQHDRTILFLYRVKNLCFAVKNGAENLEGADYSQVTKIFLEAFKESTDNKQQKQEFNQLIKDVAEKIGLEGAEVVELTDPRKLGIATLGALKQHPRIAAFRDFIEGWYISYFTPDAARALPLSGAQQRLNSRGDNLANVVQFMEREHRGKFQDILNRIAGRIPGIDKIDTEKTSDGRLLLRFNDKGFQDPFYAQQMSDGTLKVFAYLLLMEDPSPRPFICIEEPENGLYHKLLETLAAEFRSHATGAENTSQLFITTHQPYFVDALSPEEVWILEKGEDGFSTIRRASDDELVKNMVAEGLPLGGLWYSDYLDAR